MGRSWSDIGTVSLAASRAYSSIDYAMRRLVLASGVPQMDFPPHRSRISASRISRLLWLGLLDR